MRCPHCQGSLPHLHCEACGGDIPERSRFCCWCGRPVTEAVDEEGPQERVLCSDGTCIGIINEDGICNICGKPLSTPGEGP
ncbi:MAG: hypothetical protein N3G78_04905 [Desulfobacterota bacterium]|nr:hypothetical protein [Thermodesulfobacteriota bacterium]